MLSVKARFGLRYLLTISDYSNEAVVRELSGIVLSRMQCCVKREIDSRFKLPRRMRILPLLYKASHDEYRHESIRSTAGSKEWN